MFASTIAQGMHCPRIIVGIQYLTVTDWMHDTARCLGYPSDSSRATRQAGPGHGLRAPGHTTTSVSTTTAVVTSVTAPSPRAAGRGAARAGPVRPCRVGSPPPPPTLAPSRCRGLCRPHRDATRLRCGSGSLTYSSLLWLASGLPTASGHGPSAGLLVGVLHRRPVSPSTTSSSC